MHFNVRQLIQDCRRVHQRWPVELDILPGCDVAVPFVISPRHMGKATQLARGQNAVGDCHAQHICMQLQIEPVHQSQWLELIFRQFTGQAAAHLIAELFIPTTHDT